MCRNIKVLRRAGASPTEEELHLAALQYIRKVSGFRKPSRANQLAFDAAVLEVSATTGRLLESLTVGSKAVEAPIDQRKPDRFDPRTRPRVRRYPSPCWPKAVPESTATPAS